MDVEIRRLLPDDAALLERVAVEVFDEPVDPKRVAAYLIEPGHFMIVALAGNAPLSFTGTRTRPPSFISMRSA